MWQKHSTSAVVGQSLRVGGCVYCSPCFNPCWKVVHRTKETEGTFDNGVGLFWSWLWRHFPFLAIHSLLTELVSPCNCWKCLIFSSRFLVLEPGLESSTSLGSWKRYSTYWASWKKDSFCQCWILPGPVILKKSGGERNSPPFCSRNQLAENSTLHHKIGDSQGQMQSLQISILCLIHDWLNRLYPLTNLDKVFTSLTWPNFTSSSLFSRPWNLGPPLAWPAQSPSLDPFPPVPPSPQQTKCR